MGSKGSLHGGGDTAARAKLLSDIGVRPGCARSTQHHRRSACVPFAFSCPAAAAGVRCLPPPATCPHSLPAAGLGRQRQHFRLHRVHQQGMRGWRGGLGDGRHLVQERRCSAVWQLRVAAPTTPCLKLRRAAADADEELWLPLCHHAGGCSLQTLAASSAGPMRAWGPAFPAPWQPLLHPRLHGARCAPSCTPVPLIPSAPLPLPHPFDYRRRRCTSWCAPSPSGLRSGAATSSPPPCLSMVGPGQPQAGSAEQPALCRMTGAPLQGRWFRRRCCRCMLKRPHVPPF